MDHFPYYEFEGDPYSVGHAHGKRLQASIRRQVDETLNASKILGMTRSQALDWALDQVPRLDALGGEVWMEELKGLADGADIPLAAAVALQVRPGSGFLPEGCTALGVSGDASATGQPIGAQNRDLVPAYRPRMVLLQLRPRGRPAMLMLSVPGELGGVGMNEHGVAVFNNSLWSQGDRHWQAPPLTRRALLECASAEEAATKMSAMKGPAIGNFLVIDAAGRLRDFEVLSPGTAVIARDRGILVHGNHCLDRRLRPHEVEPSPAPGSPGRCERMQSLLQAAAGALNVEEVKHVLADHSGNPEAICRHAKGKGEWETAAAIIAEPASRTLHLSYGPPCERRFASYRIGC